MQDRTRRVMRFWTDADLAVVSDPSLSAAEAAEMLDRTPDDVRNKRSQIRRGWAPKRIPWSSEDDAFILNTPHFTTSQVAHHLGREATAVKHRRALLADLHNVTFTRDTKSPHVVGVRRLLARTCFQCGLLLDASWFAFNRQYGGAKNATWATRCGRCEGKANGVDQRDWKSRRASAQATRARLQAASMPTAHKSGEPWLKADDEIIASPDLTALEKAIQVKRTYEAVHTRCSKLGFVSKTGKGDVEKGRWVIDNPQSSAWTPENAHS